MREELLAARVPTRPRTRSAPQGRVSARRHGSFRAKHVFWVAFGLLTLFVLHRYEAQFLDSRSPVWEHFAPVKWWLLPHGLAGALALFLAPFQFSARLRRRSPRLHRILGRLYVAGVAVAAPAAVPIAVIQGPPTLVMAAVIQSAGWLLTTALALYCVRRGNIQQHREWMTRSYPFAMVFVFARAILAIPAVGALGEVGLVSAVWSCIAAACFVPSLVINWRAVFRRNVSDASGGGVSSGGRT